MIPEAGLLPGYPTTIPCRASPGPFGHYSKPGYFRTVRLLYDVGLLPDCLNYPRSRAAPGLSGYSPKSGFPLLPRLRKAFLRRQERIFMVFTILSHSKTSSLRTHSWYKYIRHTVNMIYESPPLTHVGLFPIKSEHKLTLPAPSRAALPSMGE